MKILIVDDEESLLKLLKLSISDENHEVFTAPTAAEGLETSKKEAFDAIVLDIGLPDRDGLDLLGELHLIHPDVPKVMITAHGSIETALKAMKTGAYDYIQKPFEAEELKLVLERAIRETQLLASNTRLQQEVERKYDFSNIIGNSGAIKKTFERIKKAADTKGTILITGESGTGKELLAKCVHFNSNRRDKALIVVDCTSIPNNLLESELFGHVKGAFTGADSTKKGLCEEADKGSLFLDEIGELPLELQAKLLRLLQEGTIRRVGANDSIQIDIRVIAATNRNLETEVKEGRFREDLYYRLNVIPLHSPSLRERTEDIPLLARHFLQRYSKEYDREVERIDPAVINKFLSYEWPGNIRQLENLIEQMVIMCEAQALTLEALPESMRGDANLEPPQIADHEWDLKKAISSVQRYTEEMMIKKALQHTGHNKTKSAELLGISRRALIYKVQEYQLDPSVAEDEDTLV